MNRRRGSAHRAVEMGAPEITNLQRRPRRVVGQLHGIQRMLEAGRPSVDILTQIGAARSALHGVAVILLRAHLRRCVDKAVRAGQTDALNRYADEILTAMSRVHPRGDG